MNMDKTNNTIYGSTLIESLLNKNEYMFKTHLDNSISQVERLLIDEHVNRIKENINA